MATPKHERNEQSGEIGRLQKAAVRGESPATPFVALTEVIVVIVAVVAVVVAVAFLAYSLA